MLRERLNGGWTRRKNLPPLSLLTFPPSNLLFTSAAERKPTERRPRRGALALRTPAPSFGSFRRLVWMKGGPWSSGPGVGTSALELDCFQLRFLWVASPSTYGWNTAAGAVGGGLATLKSGGKKNLWVKQNKRCGSGLLLSLWYRVTKTPWKWSVCVNVSTRFSGRRCHSEGPPAHWRRTFHLIIVVCDISKRITGMKCDKKLFSCDPRAVDPLIGQCGAAPRPPPTRRLGCPCVKRFRSRQTRSGTISRLKKKRSNTGNKRCLPRVIRCFLCRDWPIKVELCARHVGKAATAHWRLMDGHLLPR